MTAFARTAVVLLLGLLTPLHADTRLINGSPVPPEEHPEIINIRTGNAGCTATVIGPRVGITAAHCGANGATTQARINGKIYTGRITRSSLYPRQDHDVALILFSEVVALPPGKSYMTVTTVAPSVGMVLRLFGYGCTSAGGGGGNDGVLRSGDTRVTGFSGFDAVSKTVGGAALCYGDSGGPGLREVDGRWLLTTINSKGNIRDTNYTARLDLPESKALFDDFIAANKVDICGINRDCFGAAPPGGDVVVENAAVKIVVTRKTQSLDIDYVRVAAENLARFLSSQVTMTDSDVVHPIGPPPDLEHDIVNPIGPAQP